MSALESLRERLAELADLSSLGRLAAWDQRTMMPRGRRRGAGAAARRAGAPRCTSARPATTSARGWTRSKPTATWATSTATWCAWRGATGIASAASRPSSPPSACRPPPRARPSGRTRAHGRTSPLFAPALERNVALAREYAACFDDGGHPYDALLADYDYGLTAARVQAIFGPLAQALPPLVAEAAARPAALDVAVPVEAQQAAVGGVLRQLGVREERWRVDVSPHPFSLALSTSDLRVTTRYTGTGLESLLAAVHEYGHALYESQIAPELARTNLGHGTSMSVHESQSKLWENHVARNAAFAAGDRRRARGGRRRGRPGGAARRWSCACARR